MSLFIWYFVFLLVHSYTLTVTTALPVSKILKSQAHEPDSKQIKASAELFPLGVENEAFRHSTPPFKTIHNENFEEDEEKKKELQPCKVSNMTYQHKEQIPRSDPCEMCVCVDAEIYCFWKLCNYINLTTFTQAPPNAYKSKQGTIKQSKDDNNVTLEKSISTEKKTNEIETKDEKFSKILKDQRKFNALKKMEATSPENMKNIKTQNVIDSTEKPTVCYVMGVTYKYGEVLPRDTGTCLECACSEGGRVSCTPKDCVSQPDLDYLSHNNNLDMFDLDTF